MSGAVFPPAGPTVVQKTIPSHLFLEYNDDPNLQALVAAYNQLAQARVTWFDTINLPIYTQSQISGSLLDLVAQGIYGMSRPALPFGRIEGIGPLNTWQMNLLQLNAARFSGSISFYATTDDIFKRCLTWNFFKGDGFQFSTHWLKRRVMRFLLGSMGTAPNIDNTYPVSVVTTGDDVVITVTLTPTAGITLYNAQILQAAVTDGVLNLPFQWNFSVVIVNDLVPTNLINVGGVLTLGPLFHGVWPTSMIRLRAGGLYFTGTPVANNILVKPGVTPNPYATPLVYGVIDSQSLLALGGGNLPLSNPGAGSNVLWNNANSINVA